MKKIYSNHRGIKKYEFKGTDKLYMTRFDNEGKLLCCGNCSEVKLTEKPLDVKTVSLTIDLDQHQDT